MADSVVNDPFGNVLGTTGSKPSVGFQGDWTDPTSGLVWMAARWYQPKTGTFVSRDTYPGEIGAYGTINRYTYGLNNPLRFTDPTGRFSIGEVQFVANDYYVPNNDNGTLTTGVGQTESGNTYSYGAEGNTTIGTGNTYGLNSSENTVTGGSNTVTGGNNVVGGYHNSILGGSSNNVVYGNMNTIVSGSNNYVFGTNNKISGQYNYVDGSQNSILGDRNAVEGDRVTHVGHDWSNSSEASDNRSMLGFLPIVVKEIGSWADFYKRKNVYFDFFKIIQAMVQIDISGKTLGLLLPDFLNPSKCALRGGGREAELAIPICVPG